VFGDDGISSFWNIHVWHAGTSFWNKNNWGFSCTSIVAKPLKGIINVADSNGGELGISLVLVLVAFS